MQHPSIYGLTSRKPSTPSVGAMEGIGTLIALDLAAIAVGGVGALYCLFTGRLLGAAAFAGATVLGLKYDWPAKAYVALGSPSLAPSGTVPGMPTAPAPAAPGLVSTPAAPALPPKA